MPPKTCHATTISSVSTVDDEYAHDDDDGSKNFNEGKSTMMIMMMWKMIFNLNDN